MSFSAKDPGADNLVSNEKDGIGNSDTPFHAQRPNDDEEENVGLLAAAVTNNSDCESSQSLPAVITTQSASLKSRALQFLRDSLQLIRRHPFVSLIVMIPILAAGVFIPPILPFSFYAMLGLGLGGIWGASILSAAMGSLITFLGIGLLKTVHKGDQISLGSPAIPSTVEVAPNPETSPTGEMGQAASGVVGISNANGDDTSSGQTPSPITGTVDTAAIPQDQTNDSSDGTKTPTNHQRSSPPGSESTTPSTNEDGTTGGTSSGLHGGHSPSSSSSLASLGNPLIFAGRYDSFGKPQVDIASSSGSNTPITANSELVN